LKDRRLTFPAKIRAFPRPFHPPAGGTIYANDYFASTKLKTQFGIAQWHLAGYRLTGEAERPAGSLSNGFGLAWF